MQFFEEILKEFRKIENIISEEAKENFINHEYNKLSEYHFSIGTYIRNSILLKKGKIYEVLSCSGISYDEMSDFLIRLLYFYLNDKK